MRIRDAALQAVPGGRTSVVRSVVAPGASLRARLYELVGLFGQLDPVRSPGTDGDPLLHETAGPRLPALTLTKAHEFVDSPLRELRYELALGRHHCEDLAIHLERPGAKPLASLAGAPRVLANASTTRVKFGWTDGATGPLVAFFGIFFTAYSFRSAGKPNNLIDFARISRAESYAAPRIGELFVLEGATVKAYLVITGTLFGLLALQHLLIAASERSKLTTDPWQVVGVALIGVVAGGLSVWAWQLLRNVLSSSPDKQRQ